MKREEAIERFNGIINAMSISVAQAKFYPTKAELDELCDMAIEALQDRPKGEWKQTITWQPYCSNCEYVFDEDEAYSPFWKFCPMCGAEMADNSLVNDITESPNDVVESQNDVIEVVRCKDCRHRDLFSCPLADNDFQKDEDFCSWGERREEVNGFKSVGQAWNTSQDRKEPHGFTADEWYRNTFKDGDAE